MSRISTSVVVAVALLAATPASAQVEQTSDGALKFLGQALSRAKVTWPGSDRFAWVVGTSITIGDHKASSCRTKLTFEDHGASGALIGNREVVVNWEAVAEVKQGGSVVIVKTTYPETTYYTLAAEGMAARVAYAMDFMRQYCDPGADTGF